MLRGSGSSPTVSSSLPDMNTINLDQVRVLAPAAFSISPDSSLSDSYAHVTTAKVLEALQQDGWQIVSARQTRARRPESLEHNRHEIALTHPELPVHTEGAPVLRLANSSDGGSAIRLIGGFLRFACLNQLYSGIKVVGGVFYHRGGGLEDRVVTGARLARANFDRVVSRVDLWRSIKLDWEQQGLLAIRGMEARWPELKGRREGYVLGNYHDIHCPRRAQDVGDDLWTSFNRVQESMVRGGFIASFRHDEPGGGIRWTERHVRRITSLAATERINTQLWEAAEAVAEGRSI